MNDIDTLIRLLELAPKISTREGFVGEYFDRLKSHTSCADSYWDVESDHISIFGRTRYNGHDTFKVVLSKWNKARRGV